MAQQTAVEWLVKMLYSPVCKGFIEGRTQIPFHIIEQAKAMEKEHIMKAFSDGQQTPMNHPTLPHYSRDEYYNEQYGK
jgi:hypothetical protein